MKKTAVIIGGSISGLLCATTLSSQFEKVIIVERDKILDPKSPRKGTAQFPHAHVLLKRGLQGFQNLLPGFVETLKKEGAVSTDVSQDWQSLFPKGFMCRFKSDIVSLCQTRQLLEQTLRQFVMGSLANLEIIEQGMVINMQLEDHCSPEISFLFGQQTRHLKADLLIDCSGRNTKTPIYLEKRGFGAVPKKTIYPYLGYSSRIFKNVRQADNFLATLIMASDPLDTRGGIVLPVENHQHIVTLFGFSKDYPPGDEDAFLEFARNLRADTIYNAIKDAQAVTKVKQFVKNESHFAQYNKMKRWPKGFLVVGDAVTSFNPIYGQGMTATILAVEVLKAQINSQTTFDSTSCQLLQSKLCNSYQLPWTTSQNEDLRWPKTTGMTASPALRMLHKFSDMVTRAGTQDPAVAFVYYSVLHMTKSPSILLRPDILFKIIKYGLKVDKHEIKSKTDYP